jgi:hypothetical protein
MRQDGQSVGISLDPVGADDDLGALAEPLAGDLGDDAVREADGDLERPDEIALPEPQESGRFIQGG